MRLLFCALVISIGLSHAALADKINPPEVFAAQVAEEWLTLMDTEEYAKSWVESASYFKGAVTQAQWLQSASAARQPLGSLIRRSLKSANYMTTLPGAPDGQYVILQYEAEFKNKKYAIETITPMLDKDGKWRVSGYFIK